MRFRKLRIAFSAVCGVACLLLVALWVRTIYACDSVHGPLLGDSSLVVTSRQGGLGAGFGPSGPGITAQLKWELSVREPTIVPHRKYVTLFGLIQIYSGVEGVYVRVHDVLLIAAITLLGAAPWYQWSTRFSLRTLLLVTTLVAVVLGTIVVAMH